MVGTESSLGEAIKEGFWEEVTLKEEKRCMHLIRKVMVPRGMDRLEQKSGHQVGLGGMDIKQEPVERDFYANTLIRVCQTRRPLSRSPVAQESTAIDNDTYVFLALAPEWPRRAVLPMSGCSHPSPAPCTRGKGTHGPQDTIASSLLSRTHLLWGGYAPCCAEAQTAPRRPSREEERPQTAE